MVWLRGAVKTTVRSEAGATRVVHDRNTNARRRETVRFSIVNLLLLIE
jgi:hypothetical protein